MDELEALRVIVGVGLVMTCVGAGAEFWESLLPPPSHERRKIVRIIKI
jgi:hypothetical protein